MHSAEAAAFTTDMVVDRLLGRFADSSRRFRAAFG